MLIVPVKLGDTAIVKEDVEGGVIAGDKGSSGGKGGRISDVDLDGIDVGEWMGREGRSHLGYGSLAILDGTGPEEDSSGGFELGEELDGLVPDPFVRAGD